MEAPGVFVLILQFFSFELCNIYKLHSAALFPIGASETPRQAKAEAARRRTVRRTQTHDTPADFRRGVIIQ